MDSIQNQIISLGEQKYAIPQENLKELVRIPAADVKNKIDKVGNLPVIKLREEFLPLLDLSDVLGIQKTYLSANGEIKVDRRRQIADRRSFQHKTDTSTADSRQEEAFIDRQRQDRRTNPESAVNIAVVFSEVYKYGLVVDKFYDSEELKLFSPGRFLSKSDIYLGTTILKDDKACLVLDILNIGLTAGLSQISESVKGLDSGSVSSENPDLENYSLLTFRNSETECFAVDLEFVERLERFSPSDFEKIGTDEVIQYRGKALALIELSQVVNCSSLTGRENQEVVVLKNDGFLTGLKVYPPVNTIESRLKLDKSTFNTPPVMGSVILDGNTTLLIDVPAMLKGVKERLNK
ncbi:MAG: chemotaxis protein CheW [Desulfobacterales bacterium]|nr:chemotaxis protein CheW [Desulfobacterales bacterium]